MTFRSIHIILFTPGVSNLYADIRFILLTSLCVRFVILRLLALSFISLIELHANTASFGAISKDMISVDIIEGKIGALTRFSYIRAVCIETSLSTLSIVQQVILNCILRKTEVVDYI